MLVGKQHGVADAHGLREIFLLVRFQESDIGRDRGIRGIDVAVHLSFRALAQFFAAVYVDLGTKLLALVAVEDTQRNADARAQGV